jgi:hypothetical protein
MPARTYWLNLFTGKTWEEFLDAGGNVSGFRESRWTTMQRLKKGDYLLCYVTGISRFIAVYETLSEPFKSETAIWEDAVFPCRVKVQEVVRLDFETAVPIHELRDELTIFQNLKSPHAWTAHVRGSPRRWKKSDGETILQALLDAKENPTKRPVDERKLSRRPTALRTKLGSVTVPVSEEDEETPQLSVAETIGEASLHTEIQYRLLKLGADMGFDVWVARNDRSRAFDGRTFSEVFKLKDQLPLQFDEATTRTIEYIDVLWLKANAIVAAFEVESTTSIYSGLLRMSDLIAMQPNINVPLYLVAPDERRDKVIAEVNRPTFAHLDPPLVDVCRYISFETLRQRLEAVQAYVRYLKHEFIDELAEVCDVEDT